MNATDVALYMGARSTLQNLLDHWGDDNDTNRAMVEMLLAHAIIKIEGLA